MSQKITYYSVSKNGQPVKTIKAALNGRVNSWICDGQIWRVTEREVMLVVYDDQYEPDFFVSIPHNHWRAKELLNIPYKPFRKLKGNRSQSIPLRRSWGLLEEVVRQNSNSMWFAGDFVNVISRGRLFKISLKNGAVYKRERKICVVAWVEEYMPIYDIVLAKALAILFRPDKIYTLF